MRARVQGDLLCSDMSAFKAANPGCTLEDFVRWHSPRDWEGDSSGGGQLSARMQQQVGMLCTAWQPLLHCSGLSSAAWAAHALETAGGHLCSSRC